MKNLTLRQLRVFAEVARELSFVRATSAKTRNWRRVRFFIQ